MIDGSRVMVRELHANSRRIRLAQYQVPRNSDRYLSLMSGVAPTFRRNDGNTYMFPSAWHVHEEINRLYETTMRLGEVPEGQADDPAIIMDKARTDDSLKEAKGMFGDFPWRLADQIIDLTIDPRFSRLLPSVDIEQEDDLLALQINFFTKEFSLSASAPDRVCVRGVLELSTGQGGTAGSRLHKLELAMTGLLLKEAWEVYSQLQNPGKAKQGIIKDEKVAALLILLDLKARLAAREFFPFGSENRLLAPEKEQHQFLKGEKKEGSVQFCHEWERQFSSLTPHNPVASMTFYDAAFYLDGDMAEGSPARPRPIYTVGMVTTEAN